MKNTTRTARLAALALSTGMALLMNSAITSAADEKVSIAVNTMQIFSSLDPAKVTDYTGYMAIVNMYDGLTTVSPSGEIVPHLAKSWDISPDGLTYTFHLRDDAKFQDGTAAKASDIAWSVKRLIGINKGPSNLVVGLIKPENITTPDDATVVFKLERQFSPFMSITPIFMAMNQKLVEANAKPEDKWGEA